MKNTSVTPSSTFDQIPSPNHTANIGARITRGIELSAVIYGSSSFDARSDSASHKPKMSPSAVPIANASTVSSNVMPRCVNILPLANQSQTRCRTISGSPKKNAGRTSVLTSTCQSANSASNSPICITASTPFFISELFLSLKQVQTRNAFNAEVREGEQEKRNQI